MKKNFDDLFVTLGQISLPIKAIKRIAPCDTESHSRVIIYVKEEYTFNYPCYDPTEPDTFYMDNVTLEDITGIINKTILNAIKETETKEVDGYFKKYQKNRNSKRNR